MINLDYGKVADSLNFEWIWIPLFILLESDKQKLIIFLLKLVFTPCEAEF